MLTSYWELVKNEGRFWLDGYHRLTEQSPAPGTPPANTLNIYAKDKSGVSALYYKNDAGTERELASLGASGGVGQVAFFDTTSSIKGNSKFLWDDTNKRLGINVSSNSLSLEVEAESATDGPQYTRYGASGGALWTMRGATNTQASPGQVSADMLLGGLGGQGRDNANNWSANVGVFAVKASQAFTASARGTYLTLETTANGATTRTERVRLDNIGALIVGGGAAQVAVTPAIEMHPPVGSTGAVIIYSMGFGSGNFGNFQGRSARGTSGSPSATQLDDAIARFSAVGYGASAYAASFRAAMTHFAAENWTDSAQGAYTVLATTPTGSTTSAERFRVGPAGQWGIGGATFGSVGNVFLSGGGSAAPSWGSHDAVTGLTSGDGHTQYALLAGRSGGQTLKGGTAAADSLTLLATAGAGVGSEWIIFKTRNNGSVENLRLGTNSTNPILLFNETAPKNLAIFSGAMAEFHLGTNANFALAEGSTFTGGVTGSCAFQAYNDAVNANTPLEFRASLHIMRVGPVNLDPISTPTNRSASSDANIYIRNNFFVIQFNDGGTVRYKYLDLTGTGVTWVHSTTAP